MAVVVQAYRFALDPAPAQERMLRSHAGAARFASGAESINACGGTARPGHAGQDPVKQEPGTRHLDQTGTAAPQGTATEWGVLADHSSATDRFGKRGRS
jgi:Helix-turn-helix domain